MEEIIWRGLLTPTDRAVIWLVYHRKYRWVRFLLDTLGVTVPVGTQIDDGLRLPHSTCGFVTHPFVRIGRNVTIYQWVTLGRADMWRPQDPGWQGITVEDEAILCAGAVIVSANDAAEPLVIGEGSVVGANAVLTRSTGPWEIWAGSPARKIGMRPRQES